MGSLTARINALSFHSSGGPDFEGFLIDPDGFEGWDDGVDMRRQSVEQLQQHGSFDLPGYLDSRVISISGNCLAKSPAELAWMRSQLTGLLADGGKARLAVDHQGSTLWADVRLASQTKFVVRGGDGKTARFQLQLWAADPRKYGETRTFGPVAPGAELPVFHYGNFPASPRFTVRAGGSPLDEGWAVYGPGSGDSRKRFKVNGSVSAGSSNIIDLATGQVTAGGVLRVGVVEDATTWAVPGGVQMTHLIDTNGDGGTLSVSITDTYI